ncbi:helix-turn-helix transcriptional regulator [uncultured Clostridium sp.]|uniref:helix-turn-helix transcriptional regulator n=1 Tax=uncultured Clostridium sp. TaxID=59620 RepID=UPI0025E0DC1F|nr:helix-turn-helix transcriptional regulator [uncultured Clostridium sp.]
MNNNIRNIIEKKGMKITFVIKKVGLAKSSFYDIMNGNSIPNLINARKISEVLKVPLDELFPEENFDMEEV